MVVLTLDFFLNFLWYLSVLITFFWGGGGKGWRAHCWRCVCVRERDRECVCVCVCVCVSEGGGGVCVHAFVCYLHPTPFVSMWVCFFF